MQRLSPVALAAAVLLDLLGIDVDVAVLGEELGQMLDGQGGALGNALVVTVVGLVGASHYEDSLTSISNHSNQDISPKMVVVVDETIMDHSGLHGLVESWRSGEAVMM